MSRTTSGAYCQKWKAIRGATCICDAVFNGRQLACHPKIRVGEEEEGGGDPRSGEANATLLHQLPPPLLLPLSLQPFSLTPFAHPLTLSQFNGSHENFNGKAVYLVSLHFHPYFRVKTHLTVGRRGSGTFCVRVKGF